MTTDEKRVWCIRAGQTGDADRLFLNENCIALGFDQVGDLNKIPNDWDSLKEVVAKAYPDYNSMSNGKNVGILFAFIHEMQKGDYIVYPSKVDKLIHIGRVEGPYEYKPSNIHTYPHQRTVKWLKKSKSEQYLNGAKFAIGSLLCLSKVNPKYYEELIGPLTNESQIEDKIEKIIVPAEKSFNKDTIDFILGRLAKVLKGYDFQGFIANLLKTMGYQIIDPENSGKGPDGGIDIHAKKAEHGVEPSITIKAQVKSYENTTIGRPTVSQLKGLLSSGEFGLFVTLSSFTKDAETFAIRNQIRLINGEQLVKLILENYDQLDPKYKEIIPLK